MLFFALEQLVQFVDQLEESGVIPLLLDQSAQLIHAFSFIRFHHPAFDEDEPI
jgi:hypothetical protein